MAKSPTVKNLLIDARDRGMKGVSKLKKADLKNAIARHNAGANARGRAGAAAGTRAAIGNRTSALRAIGNANDVRLADRVKRARGKVARGAVMTRGNRAVLPAKKRGGLASLVNAPRVRATVPTRPSPAKTKTPSASTSKSKTPTPSPPRNGGRRTTVDSWPILLRAAIREKSKSRGTSATSGTSWPRPAPSSSTKAKTASSRIPTAPTAARASSSGFPTPPSTGKASAKSSNTVIENYENVSMRTPSKSSGPVSADTRRAKSLLAKMGDRVPKPASKLAKSASPTRRTPSPSTRLTQSAGPAPGWTGVAYSKPKSADTKRALSLIAKMGAPKGRGAAVKSAPAARKYGALTPMVIDARQKSAGPVPGWTGVKYDKPPPRGMYCGVKYGPARGRLQPMSLHSVGFQRHLRSALAPVLDPITDIFQAYAEKRELSCSEPKLKGVCGPNQMVAYEMAKLFARYPPSKLGGHRGMLMWHSTGSGKALLAAALMIAFYNTGHRVVLATTLENKRNNDPVMYASNMIKFFPGFADRVMGRSVSDTAADHAALAKRLFETNGAGDGKPFVVATLEEFENSLSFGKYKVYDGPKLDGAGGIHGTIAREQRPGGKFENGTCLIVDESQNLFKSSYKKVMDALESRAVVRGSGAPMPFGSRPTKVFLLTGTPGGNVAQWLDTLSIVRRADQEKFADASDPSKFAGLFSYIDYKHPARFPRVVGPVHVDVRLTPIYYSVLLSEFSKAPKGGENRDDYLRAIKQMGDFLTSSIAGTAKARIAAEPGNEIVKLAHGREAVVSKKLAEVVRRALALPGKQYVYVGTKAISDVVCALLSKRGFARVGGNEANTPAGVAKLAASPAKRFVQYSKSAEESIGVLAGYRAVMKDRANLHGNVCKIIVAHGRDYEGLDVPALRGVHIVDPLHSAIADRQAVGRGARHCGHVGLSGEDLEVKIFRYFAAPPERIDINTIYAHLKKTTKVHATKIELLHKAQDSVRRQAALYKTIAGIHDTLPRSAGLAGDKGPDYLAFGAAQLTKKRGDFGAFEEKMKRWAVDGILFDKFFGDGKGFAQYGSGNIVRANANARRNVARTPVAPPCASCQKKTTKTSKPAIATGRAKKTVAKRPAKPTGKYANRLKSATLARRGNGLKFRPGLRNRLRSA